MLSVPVAYRLTEAVTVKGDIRRGCIGSAAHTGRATVIRCCGLSRLSEALSRFKQRMPKCRKRVYSTECFKKHSVFFVSGMDPGDRTSWSQLSIIVLKGDFIMDGYSNETRMQQEELLISEKTEFRREVGLFGGISVLAGIMIGSGIFYIGGIVLLRCGMSLGLALLVWILGGLVTLMSGICYAELGAMMPKAGGGYVYLREAYGERIAFMSGFSNFILGSSGSIAALAVAFSSAIASLMPGSLFAENTLLQKGFGILMVLILTAINIFGIKLGSTVQNIFMILKMLPIALILICGLFMGTENPELSLMPQGDVSIPALLGMMAYGVVATMWAYEGWMNLNGIAEEIKKPSKNIPLAIIFSIIGVTALYVLFNFAVYRVLPYSTILTMIGSGNDYLGTEAAGVLFGNAGGVIVAIAMVLAIFNSLNGCVMVFPRTYYAMAKDKAFFQSLGHLHPVYRTPANALVASALVSILLICTRNLSQLTSLVAFCGMLFNSLVFYAVKVFRKKYPEMHRPYKVWFYPALIYVIITIMAGLAINTFIEDPMTSAIGLAVPAAGLLLYELVFKRQREVSGELCQEADGNI